MNRIAACVALFVCASSLACKTAEIPPPAPPPPPPPPVLQWPAGCVEVHGSRVTIQVNNFGNLSLSQKCIVLDPGAVVDWGGVNLKTLLIGWAQETGCTPTVSPISCTGPNCSFTSPPPSGTTKTFCYGATVVDNDNKIKTGTDPRLIIRP